MPNLRVKTFFDRTKVVKAMDLATRQALQKIGAYIWTTARGELKRAAKPGDVADPGQPPLEHRANPQLKRLMRFAYDASTKSEVIGPQAYGPAFVPRLLEEGGTVTQVDARTGKRRTMRYAPHPYMQPALQKELDSGTIPEAWKGSVRS